VPYGSNLPMTAEQQRAMLEELARQRMAMRGAGPPTGPGRSPGAPMMPPPPQPPPGLDSYAPPPPPPNTPASPSWFGPPTPAGLPPAPVPPPAHTRPRASRRRDAFAALLDEQAARASPVSPGGVSSPSPPGAFPPPTVSAVSGYDSGAAYGGMAAYEGGKGGTVDTPSRRPPDEAHAPGLMSWIARRLGMA